MWSCVINSFSCWGSDYRRKRNVELMLLANDCSMITGSMSSFFCSPEYDQKPLCLICRERAAEIKRYNVKRHYDSQFDQENELTFDNLISICTEGAPCVLGRRAGRYNIFVSESESRTCFLITALFINKLGV